VANDMHRPSGGGHPFGGCRIRTHQSVRTFITSLRLPSFFPSLRVLLPSFLRSPHLPSFLFFFPSFLPAKLPSLLHLVFLHFLPPPFLTCPPSPRLALLYSFDSLAPSQQTQQCFLSYHLRRAPFLPSFAPLFFQGTTLTMGRLLRTAILVTTFVD
jgi:hypothetical protein